MKLKKISLILMGALTISCMFTGCSNSSDTENETEVSTEETTEDATEGLNAALTTDEISMEDLIASVKLCDYSKIEVDVTKDEVTEEDIQSEMESYIAYFDAYEHVTEGIVEDGKTVDISFVGKIDGEEFDGGSGTYDLEIGSNTFIEGFESGLIGKSVGETVTLDLTFPETYENNPDLAGKPVTFEVTINYILGDKIEAELTDEFLSANADYETVEELRNAVTEYLTATAESNYSVSRENAVLDYVISNSEIPKIPVTYIDEYKESMKTYYESYAELYGMEFSEFLDSYMSLTEEEFDADCESAAINYMQSTVVLEAIAKKENITLSDEEFNTYVETFASENGYESADVLLTTLEENGETDEMRSEALYNKIMESLFENIVEVKSTETTE